MGTTRICLIGIDGLRIGDALAGGCPFLAKLAADGAMAEMTMEVPTISGPGWTSILTGTRHAAHAVVDNTFADHAIEPGSDLLSRVAQADPMSTTFAAASWLPLLDPAGPGPVLTWREPDQQAGRHRVALRDGETNGYRTADAEIDAVANRVLAEEPVDAAFVYFGEVDEAGHRHGGASSEYRAAMSRVDHHVRALVTTIDERARRAEERWLVAVTTDHGHLDEGGHGGAEPVVTHSFLMARRYGPDAAEPIDLPDRIEPWEVRDWLLRVKSDA